MDKDHVNSIKKQKKKSNKSLITKRKNNQNETEDKFLTTTKNELISKDNNEIVQDLPSTYKNLDILFSNKLQYLGNNQKNKQISSHLIKKHNNSKSVSNLIKLSSARKQSILKICMERSNSSNTEKSNDINNQSISFLLNKETNNYKDQNSTIHLNKNKKKDSHYKHNIKRENSSKTMQKKIKVKRNSNSVPCPFLSKNHSSSKLMTHYDLLSHENLNKKLKNQNLFYLPKFENQIDKNECYDENHSQNMQKQNIKKKKRLSLSKENYNIYTNLIRNTKSLKTPKSLTNIVSHLKHKKNTSDFSLTLTSQSNKNSVINIKTERNHTSNRKRRSIFQLEKKNIQRKKQKMLTFSNCVKKYNYNNNSKKKKKSKTFLISNKIQRKNLHSILLSNRPNEIKDVNKIMSIITMDEVNKKIKESIYQYDKKELIKEIHDLETNDICEAIEKLPASNSINSDNKSNYNNNEDSNDISESNKTKYKNAKKIGIIYNASSKTKLMKYNEKYRKLLHKILIYDSLDDEEMEELEINFFYIDPNSIMVYLIDSIILISALIQLLYFPIFLAYNFEFCRNVFSIHQFMFYLIDLFYILDFITGFFRAYYNFDEFLIKNIDKIFKNYLNNWFVIDCIEAIPLYMILNRMENECKINELYFSKYYNININKFQYILLLIKSLKIIKVISINTILKKIKSKLNDFDIFFENKFILFTIFIVFSSLNFASCLFIFFGRNSYPGWIIECNIQNKSFGYIYLTAIYYLITSVTTVGYGDIIVTSFRERIYQIIILLVGTCAYSWTISYISNYIKKIDEKSMDFDRKMSILNDIKLSSENFSTTLYNKIRRYLQYNRVGRENHNEIIINSLPYPLRNTLFMEMYKNIIQNFKFFKSFENSNFIVKVVTCFKPVLSIKNDILVQDGDFIEDIIFVKEGILSLEICIDLDYAQESIEAYLNESGFGKSPKINTVKKNKKFGTNMYTCINSFNTLKLNETTTNFYREKVELNETNKKYLRILDIRKNEYYGDILMLLNERAPHRVKVKSKKAKLFYLSKTDAIEISTLYPNIWKRIIQKSLFNMKQIKNLTKKILIYFSKLNGIYLNEEMCKNINSSDSSTPQSKLNDDSQINEIAYKGMKTMCKEEETNIQNNIKNMISTVIYEEENETLGSIVNNSKLNHEFSESNKKSSHNLKISNKKITNIKNINNNIKTNQNSSSKFNTDIKQISKENNIEISKNCESKETEKLPICNNIINFSDYSDAKKLYCQIPNIYEINSEIYPNEKFNDNKYLQSDFSEPNKNSININEKIVDLKSIIKCVDSQFSLIDKNEKKYENISHSLKINDKKTTNFENLIIVNTTSATISSIYENLNKITKYKFSKDINFRKKAIQFLTEESVKMSSNNSIASNISPKIKINNQSPKKLQETTSKNLINKSKNSNNDDESSIISFSKEDFSDFKDSPSGYQIERNSQKFFKSDGLRHLSPEPNKLNILKKNQILLKNLNNHSYLKKICRNPTDKSFDNEKKNNIRNKRSSQNLNNNSSDKELNFYGRMKTMRKFGNNIQTINNNNNINNQLLTSPTKKNYLDMISHNIFENRQTLQNPEEFYMGLFANIVQKRIIKGKKSSKSKKELNKKSGEVNRYKIRNHKTLLYNNDERKIKNIDTTKRRATISEEMKQRNRLLY